ncbi:MAG: hypothetical protein BWY59_00345 [Verrucomicrobia bacterium ADurb.Bin345]|nr:MAG: hypothetical protein BWY59_00345 [Verrucomicrobia bacterium ADurb.Bin345]
MLFAKYRVGLSERSHRVNPFTTRWQAVPAGAVITPTVSDGSDSPPALTAATWKYHAMPDARLVKVCAVALPPDTSTGLPKPQPFVDR